MANAVIQVTGLREMTAMLRKLGGSVLAKRVRAAHVDVAAYVADEVKAAAPVGPTGRLAASVVPRATQRTARVSIGARLDYTKPVIFGWPAHGITPNKFPFEVLDRVAGEIPSYYADALAAAVGEVGGRA